MSRGGGTSTAIFREEESDGGVLAALEMGSREARNCIRSSKSDEKWPDVKGRSAFLTGMDREGVEVTFFSCQKAALVSRPNPRRHDFASDPDTKGHCCVQ